MFLLLGLYLIEEKIKIIKKGILGNGSLIPKLLSHPQR